MDVVGPEHSAAPAFQFWEVPGKPVAVRIASEAIEQILLHAVGSLGRIQRGRGAEVGGVLLGTAEQREGRYLVRVEAFEAVPCAHFFGPSYTLSEAEKEELGRTVERWKPAPDRRLYVVGFCRSNTREELALNRQDLDLLSSFFAEPWNVALLVKPRATGPSAAGLFIWEDGEIRPEAPNLTVAVDIRRGRRASMRAGKGQEAGASGVSTESAAPPAPAAVEQSSPAASIPAPESPELSFTLLASAPPQPRSRRRWAAGLVVLSVAALGYAVVRYGHSARTPPPDPYRLSLAAREQSENLHVTWDRNAPAVRTAERATLTISDGAYTRTLDLDAAQLRTGSVIYRPITAEVTFRIEVFIRGKSSLVESCKVELTSAPPTETK